MKIRLSFSRSGFSLALCLLFLWSALAHADPDYPEAPPKFNELYQIAIDNSKTEEGQKHEERIGIEKSIAVGDILMACMIQIEPQGKHRFTTIARLASDGSVKESAYFPKTRISKCFYEGVSELVYPVPPRDDYWIFLEMQIDFNAQQ